MRISRQAMYIGMARMASMRSTCSRLNVGAIVTRMNSPVSVGWNGAEAGAPHCPGNDCPGMVPGQCPALHAEANAIKKAEALLEYGSRVDLYSTHSPCPECCDLIIRSTIKIERIFFEIPYRRAEHLEKFRESVPFGRGMSITDRSIQLYEVTPAGYVVEYFTRGVVQLP